MFLFFESSVSILVKINEWGLSVKLARAGFLNVTTKLAGFFLLLGLSACHHQTRQTMADSPSLPCKVYNATDTAIIGLQTNLNKQGVQVVTIGQNYLISIPSKAIFAEQSPRVKWGSYGLLNEVACYLKQFRKVAITVTAFSSQYKSFERERALTLARSRAVGNYLWSQGVDSRFIFTDGFGSDKPIFSAIGKRDESKNSRIEITFRRAVA